jgi:hypothetical protein
VVATLGLHATNSSATVANKTVLIFDMGNLKVSFIYEIKQFPRMIHVIAKK